MNTFLIPPNIRIKEISTQLKLSDCKQSSFTRMETLFFEALSISRAYPQQQGKATLLEELVLMKENEYKMACAYQKKVRSKEASIKRFRFYFKKILDKYSDSSVGLHQ